MEVKRTMIASQLIIEAGEQYHKRPTQLKFEELVDVVQAVVKNCFIPPVMFRLFAITTQDGWNEMFWNKDKAQRKIDTEYKKDFPNEEFWIEEVRVS